METGLRLRQQSLGGIAIGAIAAMGSSDWGIAAIVGVVVVAAIVDVVGAYLRDR